MTVMPHSIGELDSLTQIGKCFAVTDEMFRSPTLDRTEVLHGSDFEGDQTRLTKQLITGWTARIFGSAVDQLHLLSTIANGEGGTWHIQAPWTLLRAALEMASQVVFILGPDTRQSRLEHFLRVVHEDLNQEIAAMHAAVSKRKRGKLPEVKQMRADFETEVLNAKVATTVANQDLKMLLCVLDSARRSKVAPEAAAEMYWRLASGYAHGRTWAMLTGRHQDRSRVPPPPDADFLEQIDIGVVAGMLTLITGTLENAQWLYRRRSGYTDPLPNNFKIGFATV